MLLGVIEIFVLVPRSAAGAGIGLGLRRRGIEARAEIFAAAQFFEEFLQKVFPHPDQNIRVGTSNENASPASGVPYWSAQGSF